MDAGPFVARIEAAVAVAIGETSYDIEVLSDSTSALLDETTDMWAWLSAETARESGRSAEGGEGSTSVPFATDAGWLQELGFECVIWGPGSIEVAHRANEFVPLEDLSRARATIGRAIDRWCGR